MTPRCRFCGEKLEKLFADLGVSPLANRYLTAEQLGDMEPFYPLRTYVCGGCLLVQLEEFESPEAIFGDYAYFSSYSDTWLKHAERYCGAMVARLSLGATSQIVEIASNDGYLLQYFAARGLRVLGVEPAANVAEAAIAKGIPTIRRFFGESLARELVSQGLAADLLVGNNVLAHVPKLNDFVEGLRQALKPDGVVTLEFPHLLRLIEECQFDTIYHEHFSYLSLLTAERVFRAHGLRLFDVEELPTHGGSVRVYLCHEDSHTPQSTAVEQLRTRERAAGLDEMTTYLAFSERPKIVKRELLDVLIDVKRRGQTIVAYGAAAKGNTLLNYCGVGPDFIEYAVDRSPHKQGRFLPGTRLPISSPERIRETRPDFLLVLPWNLKDEIVEQMKFIRDWGGRFIIPIPRVDVC